MPLGEHRWIEEWEAYDAPADSYADGYLTLADLRAIEAVLALVVAKKPKSQAVWHRDGF